MLSLSEILTKNLSEAVKQIGDNMDAADYNASGETKQSLAFEVTKGAGYVRGVIKGNIALEWAEKGRPPRQSNTDSGLSDRIYKWMGDRGIGQDLSEKGQRGLARFITLRINKFGTKLFREGRTRDIYTTTLIETTDKLKEELGRFAMNTVIERFEKNFNVR